MRDDRVSGVSVVLVNKIIEMLESASKLYAHHHGYFHVPYYAY